MRIISKFKLGDLKLNCLPSREIFAVHTCAILL
jgi:hypothetical protein